MVINFFIYLARIIINYFQKVYFYINLDGLIINLINSGYLNFLKTVMIFMLEKFKNLL